MKNKVEKELIINLDSTSLKSQKEHLISEFGVSITEAEDVEKLIREYVLEKLEKVDTKGWSKDVKDSFINVMTAIFIGIARAVKEGK